MAEPKPNFIEHPSTSILEGLTPDDPPDSTDVPRKGFAARPIRDVSEFAWLITCFRAVRGKGMKRIEHRDEQGNLRAIEYTNESDPLPISRHDDHEEASESERRNSRGDGAIPLQVLENLRFDNLVGIEKLADEEIFREMLDSDLEFTYRSSAGRVGISVKLPARYQVPTPPSREPTPSSIFRPSLFHRDAGLFSYTAGVLGAVAFMALAIGPGWLGFALAFLPASAFAAWAVSDHA